MQPWFIPSPFFLCVIWKGNRRSGGWGERLVEASLNCHWKPGWGQSSDNKSSSYWNIFLEPKHPLRRCSNVNIVTQGKKINSTIKPRTQWAFHGQIGKQGGGWAGQPSRLASQWWGDYRPDMLGFISLINSGLAAVTLCPLKKLKTALKGKLPWPSPRRKAQVKLRGRIQLYSPAHPCRRSALIKTSVNRSKKHISVCVTEGF